MIIEEKLNKWQILAYFTRDYKRMESGWKCVGFGVFKLIHIPPEGVVMHNEYYKGFIWRFRIWFPIESDY